MTATGPTVPPFAPGPMSTPDRSVTTSYATKERVWAPPHSVVETTRYATSPTTATGSGTGCVAAADPLLDQRPRADRPGVLVAERCRRGGLRGGERRGGAAVEGVEPEVRDTVPPERAAGQRTPVRPPRDHLTGPVAGRGREGTDQGPRGVAVDGEPRGGADHEAQPVRRHPGQPGVGGKHELDRTVEPSALRPRAGTDRVGREQGLAVRLRVGHALLAQRDRARRPGGDVPFQDGVRVVRAGEDAATVGRDVVNPDRLRDGADGVPRPRRADEV